MHQIPFALNIIDSVNLNQVSALEQKCHYDHTHDIDKAQESCAGIINYIENVSGSPLSYNAMIFTKDWQKVESPYVEYFTIQSKVQDVYKAIHIDKSTK
jgi:hypothetical protein